MSRAYFQSINFDVGAKHSGDNLALKTKVLSPNASPSEGLKTRHIRQIRDLRNRVDLHISFEVISGR